MRMYNNGEGKQIIDKDEELLHYADDSLQVDLSEWNLDAIKAEELQLFYNEAMSSKVDVLAEVDERTEKATIYKKLKEAYIEQ
ncbi:hypothetical protein [uncultured Metabacillus sp.]|uniref:hypothetical protein n=1 Tax=uncultured Metabacillus sp. TaxID=2860135 RepID=UPI00262D8323|nr:hypothetical protein [uncultured Metabacillus sp.]